MLTLLTKRLRTWAATILIATYAFGVLAPSLAFSFDSEASIVHSLTEAHGGVLMPHLHHDHSDSKDPGQRAPNGGHHCCGVLALPGLPPPIDIVVAEQICVLFVSSVPHYNHAACGPARLDRPPRHLPLI
jgi:hypothetical protein